MFSEMAGVAEASVQRYLPGNLSTAVTLHLCLFGARCCLKLKAECLSALYLMYPEVQFYMRATDAFQTAHASAMPCRCMSGIGCVASVNNCSWA